MNGKLSVLNQAITWMRCTSGPPTTSPPSVNIPVLLNGGGQSNYAAVGLDSAGFKPQSYTDSISGAINESVIVSRGTIKSGPQTFYCDELKNGGSGIRADAKAKAIGTFNSLVSGPGPYLVFTHEPDLQDPYKTGSPQES